MGRRATTFSEEIMAEILLKLPIKSITQCKILSKQYYSLINSPFFTRRHLDLTRLTNEPHDDNSIITPIVTSARLFNLRSGRAEDSEFAWGSEGHYIIHGPVDGLYCVIHPDDHVFLTVWNISTTERYVLPQLPLFHDNVGLHKCVGFGFGYDVHTDDYKVVVICGEKKKKSLYVYNVSKDGGWRNHDGLGVDPSDIESFLGVFYRGACHWIYACASSGSCYSILGLDLSFESSMTVQFPNEIDEYECYDMSIVVIGE